MWSNNPKYLLKITFTNKPGKFALLFSVGSCYLLSASVQMGPGWFIQTNICKTFQVWPKCLFVKKIHMRKDFVILPSLASLVVSHFLSSQKSSKRMETMPM